MKRPGMGQVTITLNGRSYRLHCGDGEEKRVQQLAQHVAEKMETLVGEFGSGGHDRLLVMTALLIADELFEIRDRGRGARDAAQPAWRRAERPVRREPDPGAAADTTTPIPDVDPNPSQPHAPRRESA
jgi:cell division protein ZapA